LTPALKTGERHQSRVRVGRKRSSSALSLIADVRQEEVAGALLMTLLMFLILAAHYELKTAREVFISAKAAPR
jgi:ATP/ADP translocase